MQGAGPCLEELQSPAQTPTPKMWGKSHLHAGYSPFNGKELLVLLLESSAPSIRSVHGPQQPEGCQGNSPSGERCRLCQVSRDWHREHTWSGITCPGQGCALSQPRAWDRSNPCIQPHDVLRESNIQGLQGSNHCWLHSAPSPAQGQQRIWALQPQELLHSPGKSRAAAPLPSLNCHTLVPFPGNKCSFAGQKQKLK